MHRSRPIIGRGTEVVAAAVTSIVLTVLTLMRTVLAVHADQTGWDETAVASTPAPVDESDRTNGGGSTWV